MRLVPASLKSSWSWWWGFGLLIAAPALVLALLGLRAVRAERIEREQQLREQQAQVARLADAALTNALAGIEGELRRAETGGQGRVEPSDFPLADGYAFSLDRQGLLTFSHQKVYFGERTAAKQSPDEWSPTIEQLIEEAQAAEAQERTSGAMTIYRRIISTEPKLRAWAGLSIARIQHRSGETAALAWLTNPDWSRSEELTPTGLPVAFIACAYAERVSHEERARFIPLLEQTIESLRDGRWWLSYDERRFYDTELRRLLESAGSNNALPEDARLDELSAIEQVIRRSPPHQRDGVIRSFERGARGAFLILWSPDREPEIWIGLTIPQRRLANLLETAVRPLLAGQPYSAAIRDAQGDVVWGQLPDGARVSHTEGLRAVSGWELAFSNPANAGWMDQRQLLWYGFILLLVVMLMVGLAMTARVVRREVELGRMQNEFIAAVSHEFKSPITSIRLLMERITSGRLQHTPEATYEYYAAISRETDRLERLVNRLLEAQQIQAGRKDYSFAPASLIKVIKTAIKRMQPQAETKRIDLELQTESDIPEMALDEAAITDAVQNLLDNAIKYSPSGTRVTITLRAAHHQVCVEVCDQGIGIEPGDLARIFDKFYRGRRGDQQSVHGTGLGLALVKAAAEAHGGSVEVTSEPGQGSRFSLCLPTVNGGRRHGTHSDR